MIILFLLFTFSGAMYHFRKGTIALKKIDILTRFNLYINIVCLWHFVSRFIFLQMGSG